MENPEEVLQTLDEFTKLKPKDIPKELEDYLSYVAKTGDPVYQWSLVKALFREKLLGVITDFYESCPSVDLPPCPNVDTFNYETMKDRLIERLELFGSAPFTVQRLCELLTSPKKQYSRADKFMRAVEKNIMVVSTREPGPVRRNDNTQAELVNGVTENVGLDNESSRVSLGLAESVDSSTSTTPFLNTEGSVQVIFEDSSLDKTHSPTKPYEESYEDGVPRRGASWFRERVESSDKLSAFGPQIHNQVPSRMNEEGDVEVGNQLAEKYSPVTDRGIVEEDDDDIDDEYRNVGVTHFHSQEPGPTLLGLESTEEYCCPSPDEENSETSVAVSTITEEISNPIPESHIHEGGASPTAATISLENSKDVLTSSEGESSTSDIQNDEIESVTSSLETATTDEKQDSISVQLIDESTVRVPTACTETSMDSENDKLPYTEQTPVVMPVITEEISNGDTESLSSEALVVEVSLAKDETESIDSSEPSKDDSPEPTVDEPLDSETSGNDLTKECQEVPVDPESTVPVVECSSVKDTEPLEAETIEMSILESLGPIATEENSDDTAPEVSTLKDVLPTPESIKTSADFTLDNSTKKTDVEDMAETVSELPVEVLEPLTTSTSPDVTQSSSESAPSIEKERDREMLIQNERVESVIQENVEQTPLQEEVLMQQIFVPNEIPMDEKTLDCEPEAMDVDETSQTVEEPMEQGDTSPTIS